MYLKSEMWQQWRERGQTFSILGQHCCLISQYCHSLHSTSSFITWDFDQINSILIFVKCCNKMLFFYLFCEKLQFWTYEDVEHPPPPPPYLFASLEMTWCIVLCDAKYKVKVILNIITLHFTWSKALHLYGDVMIKIRMFIN